MIYRVLYQPESADYLMYMSNLNKKNNLIVGNKSIAPPIDEHIISFKQLDKDPMFLFGSKGILFSIPTDIIIIDISYTTDNLLFNRLKSYIVNQLRHDNIDKILEVSHVIS